MSKEPDIQSHVLEKIRRGEVAMRPRAYFALSVAATVLVALLALACSIFALSFAVFSIHESGEQFLLGFGVSGIETFFALFPWLPFFAAVLLVILLEALLRRFRFAYRLPLLGLFLSALALALAGGVLVGFTPLHSFLLDRADNDQLPLIGPLYEAVRDSHQDHGVYRGTITALSPGGFTLSHADRDTDADDGTWTIVLPAGFATSSLATGMRVYVAGRPASGVVYAYGIQIESGP